MKAIGISYHSHFYRVRAYPYPFYFSIKTVPMKVRKGITDMPSQKASFKHWDTYTVAPVLIFQIQSYARLTAIESNVFNYVVLGSINVYGKNHTSDIRQWFYISPSEFAQQRGHSRQGVADALKNLVDYGLILSRDVSIQTAGGLQKGREYRLISNEKLNEMFELLSKSATPKGASPACNLSQTSFVKGCRPDLTRVQVVLDKGAGPACHLVRPCLHPWGIKESESLENLAPKDSLNIIKNFLNTFLKFDNSFYELHSSVLKSKTAVFKMEMKIASLIRQYGLFSTYTAMLVCLFKKDAQIGCIKLTEAFLKNNSEKFKEYEQDLIVQSDNLFQDLNKLYMQLSDSDTELENFFEVFRQNASVLLVRKELELRSRGIFLYSGYEKDLLDTFIESNWKMQRFTKEWIQKLNLYLKIKLLGHKGLNFVQS